ncbi:THO complex subunit 3 like protein [Verticillium longisporum]|uniref:THO complex subunit 3 like protein n=1 Tax=Verticillium longisporum TaxID=100787 RepID=A0A8I3A3S6_VERLO|nr:THO complex subunit 3 like protein [Verticillium longisporum]
MFDKEKSSIWSISWNPTGSLIATGADRILRVWNPEKPVSRFSTELKGHTAAIAKVAFNPAKDAELCSISFDGVAKFWDVRSKTCTNEVKGLGEAFTLAWAPDGETLVVGNKADTLFVLSPTQTVPLSTHTQDVQTNQVSFCWSGEKVFLTTGEGRVRILSYPDFQPLLHRDGPDGAIEFTLDGHASQCLSAEMQPTARYLATEHGHHVCFTFDGSYCVGGSEQGAGLDVFHTETGDTIHTIKTSDPSPVVAWAPTRYYLAFIDQNALRIAGIDTERK